MADPNLALLRAMALAPGPLRERLIFVGECVTGKLLTHPLQQRFAPRRMLQRRPVAHGCHHRISLSRSVRRAVSARPQAPRPVVDLRTSRHGCNAARSPSSHVAIPRYRESAPSRAVAPTPEAVHRLRTLDEALPEHSRPALDVLRRFDAIGSPATAAMAGGRHFGFVIGGAPPMATAANWLATAWDQNAVMHGPTPGVAAFDAKRFAEGLQAAGYEVLNVVVLNQVLVSFGDAATMRQVIDEMKREGTCWRGATSWQARTAMRMSVSSWATTQQDLETSLAAVIGVARRVVGGPRRRPQVGRSFRGRRLMTAT